MINYIMPALPVSALPDSLVGLALACVGVVFCLIALFKIAFIAWHNLSQTLTRQWHLTSHFARTPSRSRS